jgi:acetyl-CoA carboxylase, biotin carboxylase subunit
VENYFDRILLVGNNCLAKEAITAAQELGIEVGIAIKNGQEIPSWAELADFNIVVPNMSMENPVFAFAMIKAAIDAGCQAIYPNWSNENLRYAMSSLTAATDISFIGGQPDQLATIRNRVGVRWAAGDLKMDVVSTSEKISTMEDAEYWLLHFGYPVVLRTLREKSVKLTSKDDAVTIIPNKVCDGPIVLERFVPQAREIETVMFALPDKPPVCLGEVEVTLRMGGQKSVAEYPPVGIDNRHLFRMRRQAAQLIMGARWEGVISARFLIASDGRPYFLQLIPGIQPWHLAIAHAIGVDLFDAQIRVANGDELGWSQRDILYKGHTITLQLSAQDSGVVTNCSFPERKCLTGIGIGDYVDKNSTMAIIAANGPTRQAAIVQAKNILNMVKIDGMPNNITQLHALFNCREYWENPISREVEY